MQCTAVLILSVNGALQIVSDDDDEILMSLEFLLLSLLCTQCKQNLAIMIGAFESCD